MSLTTSAASTATVTWGNAGDVVHVEHETLMLFKRCDRDTPAFYCTHHQQPLANRGQLEMHLENARDSHFIIGSCPRHGFEACTDPR